IFITIDENMKYEWNLETGELISFSNKDKENKEDCPDIIDRMEDLSYFMRGKVKYCNLNNRHDRLVTIDDENDIVIWSLDSAVKSYSDIKRDNIQYNWILNAETMGARWRM
ncbi:MAG: hypothetical protein AB2806_14400, partial [Candidatus Thiodiazotropha sp.]